MYDEVLVDNDTIKFSSEAWEDEKNYFMSFIKDEIDKYEKRHKSEVIGIALIGTVGIWTGNHFGGKVYLIDEIKNILFMNVDDIDITIDEDRVIWINGHHHDGTHHMKIHFITKNKVRKIGFSESALNTFECLEELSKILKPLTLPKNNKYFNI